MAEKVKLTKVVTGVIRLSYVHLAQPYGINGSEPKYSCCVLIRKDDTYTLNALNAAIAVAKEEGKVKWGGKVPAVLKLPLRDGDLEKPDDEAYAGCFFFNCSSKVRPTMLDRLTNEILDPTEVYSGCYAKVSVNLYAFSMNGNKGIAVGLNHVQKIKDGEAFGGRGRAQDDFTVVESEEDFLG